jgi:hypothetical protein
MVLDFYLNFIAVTTTYNFNCITYVNPMGSHIVRTLYVPNPGPQPKHVAI